MPIARQTDPAGENNSHHSTKYRIEEAIGDLIDNSIDAKARNISVYIYDQNYTEAGSPKVQGVNEMNYPKGLKYLYGKQMYLLLIDDGTGMDKDEMREALVYGRRRKYEDYELGHFGVGLKNSTMSQAYEATVISKKEGKINIVRISSVHIQSKQEDQLLEKDDLENLYPWMSNTEGYKMALDELDNQESGTAILLEGLHKIERDIGAGTGRQEYIDSIIKRLRSQIGLTFNRYISGKYKIKRTNGKTKQIKPIKMSINSDPIHPLDPFYTEFTDDNTNHWTLKRPLASVTKVGDEPTVLDGTAYIIPKQSELKNKSKAKNIMDKLMFVREELTRGELQGIYLFRHQRLIDYASTDPWKALGKAHNDTVVGRWEIHLPPHNGNQLQDLDFTLDKTKTDTKIGKTTRENLESYWSTDTYLWHQLDTSSYGSRRRMKFRTNRTPSQPLEVQCVDCGTFGHVDKQSPLCNLYVPSPPVGGSGGSGGSGSSGGSGGSGGSSGSGGSGGSASSGSSGINIKTSNSGDLTKVDGNKVEINLMHPAYNEVKKWFKKRT